MLKGADRHGVPRQTIGDRGLGKVTIIAILWFIYVVNFILKYIAKIYTKL